MSPGTVATRPTGLPKVAVEPTVSGDRNAVCATCGCASTLPEVFRLGRSGRWTCPSCYAAECLGREAVAFRNLVFWLALAAALALVFHLAGWSYYLWANVVLFYAALYALVIPHELAHAVAAWLSGGRVFELRFGTGPLACQLWWRGVRLALYRYPNAGSCTWADPGSGLSEWRTILTAGAGMAFNLAVALVLGPRFEVAQLWSAWAPIEVTVLASVAHVLSAWGWRGGGGAPTLGASDGTRILRAIGRQRDRRAVRALYHLLGAIYAWQRRDVAAAAAHAQAGLVESPADAQLQSLLALTMLREGETARSAAIFEAIAARCAAESCPAPDRLARAHSLSNLAYIVLLEGTGAEQLDRAMQQAREAFAMVPWDASVAGTFGALQVETGDVHAGHAHLREALKRDPTVEQKAFLHAWLSRAYSRMGDQLAAEASLASAARLDPHCPFLARMHGSLD